MLIFRTIFQCVFCSSFGHCVVATFLLFASFLITTTRNARLYFAYVPLCLCQWLSTCGQNNNCVTYFCVIVIHRFAFTMAANKWPFRISTMLCTLFRKKSARATLFRKIPRTHKLDQLVFGLQLSIKADCVTLLYKKQMLKISIHIALHQPWLYILYVKLQKTEHNLLLHQLTICFFKVTASLLSFCSTSNGQS